MAFAAATSAWLTLAGLEDSPRISIPSSTQQTIISYQYDEAQWKLLIKTLYSFSQVLTASEEGLIVEGIIIDEARRLEDAFEFAVSAQFLEQSKSCKPTFSLKLDHLKQDVDRFAETAEKMRIRIHELWDQKIAKVIEEDVVEICVPRREEDEGAEADVSALAADMVGLNDEFHRLRDTITRGRRSSSHFYNIVYWISGMAGVGKTRFVERIYEDPLVKETFECRAFVRVGRECRPERVLRAVTAQLNRGQEKRMQEGDEEEIYQSFCTTFRTKRCLIVLDDVWDEEVAKNLIERSRVIRDEEGEYVIEKRTVIPCLGSYVLLTSRMEPSTFYDYCLKIRFLNEEESWELLKRKVFVEEEGVCPPLLVEAGKKIAKKCGGLPLLIIAVADQLRSKVEKNQESWKRVAERPNSVLEEASSQISEVLISSYNDLDEVYKLHFLYISAFPQTDVVFCSTIIKLWYAEGFFNLVPESFWDSAKSNAFQLLHGKNLVITDEEKSWSSIEMKACSLHCAYWYVCKRVAKDNRFLYIMNSFADGTDECVRSHNRLAVQTTVLLTIKEVADVINSISTVRSLLCTGPYHQYQVPICSEWKLLKVLDVLSIRFYEFPVEVVQLILLRYLSLTCNANLPPPISKLWRLQFLIVHLHRRIRRVAAGGDEWYVPVEIWDLQELIHLEIPGRNLPYPPHPGVVLPTLEKLLGVGVESCTRGVLRNIPKLKKLRIQTELAPDAAETLICFYSIKSFQCVVMNPTLLLPPPLHSIPIFGLKKVKKLSLSGCGCSWEEMSKISKLVNLKVLKLRCYAANREMKFKNLEYLYIEDTDLVQWSVVRGKKTMPRLKRLTMKNCHKLHEIPRFSRSDMKIELVDCNPLAETWAKQYYGAFAMVSATYSWKKKST